MILIVSNSTKNTMGGVEIFNEELESLFSERNIENYKIESSFTNKISNYLYRTLFTLIYSYKNFRKVDFILIQYGNFLDILILPILFFSFKKIKIIAHIGDSWKHINNQILNGITNIFLNIFVDTLFIITDEQRKFLKHKRTKKIHTIINKDFLTKPKIKKHNTKYILFLGRVCKEKGIEDLIEVYLQLSLELNIPKLLIVGPITNEYKNYIEEILEKKDLKNSIIIQKPIYDIEKKIELIDDSHILIYPSYADAFPLTVIETFARKICCIATRISETKNFISTDELLFEPGNRNELYIKLKKYIKDPLIFESDLSIMYEKSIKYAQGQIVDDMLHYEENK